MKKYAAMTVGILVFVIASASVYEILNVNNIIQAKPEQSVSPDYSAELGSLKSQIGSVSNNLTSLDTVKSKVTEIQGKLFELETKLNQSQQASGSQKPAIILNKYVYFPGETAHITAVGATPSSAVQIQLLDNYGFAVLQKGDWANYGGHVASDLLLPTSVVPGNFQIRLISGAQSSVQPIVIMGMAPNYGSVTLSGLSYQFSALTEKTVYQPGDEIEVLGVGKPNTSITGVLTSPTWKTWYASTTIQQDGSYAMFFADSQPFEAGTWFVTLTNQGLQRTVYLSVQPYASSNGYTFTAQTDKTIYKKGELIQISGTGKPYTTVKTVLTSPSGIRYNGIATASFDGSYTIDYSTSPSYETGNWYIGVTNWGVDRVISIFLEPI